MTSPFIQDSTHRQTSGGTLNAAPMSTEVQTFNWLLDSFTSGTAGVVEAIAVSSDGLLMATSASKERAGSTGSSSTWSTATC